MVFWYWAFVKTSFLKKKFLRCTGGQWGCVFKFRWKEKFPFGSIMLIKCHKWQELPVNGFLICCLCRCHWSKPAADDMGAGRGWRPRCEGSIKVTYQWEPRVGKLGFPQHCPSSVRGLWQPILPATSLKLTFLCQWMLGPFPAPAGKCWGAQVTKWNQESDFFTYSPHPGESCGLLRTERESLEDSAFGCRKGGNCG